MAPLARETFGGNGPAWDADNIHRLYTRVKPDFIRVDADEVTYPAHVILRYRLERALIAGDMELDDLPAAWNAGMKELLGIVPPSRPRGLPAGHPLVRRRLGLFPDLHAGRHDRRPAVRRRPPRPAGDSRGASARATSRRCSAWLRDNVHGHGSRLSNRELLTRATGRPLDPAVFKRHLETRYLS